MRMGRLWEGSSTLIGCYQSGNACVKAFPLSGAAGRHASETAGAGTYWTAGRARRILLRVRPHRRVCC